MEVNILNGFRESLINGDSTLFSVELSGIPVTDEIEVQVTIANSLVQTHRLRGADPDGKFRFAKTYRYIGNAIYNDAVEIVNDLSVLKKYEFKYKFVNVTSGGEYEGVSLFEIADLTPASEADDSVAFTTYSPIESAEFNRRFGDLADEKAVEDLIFEIGLVAGRTSFRLKSGAIIDHRGIRLDLGKAYNKEVVLNSSKPLMRIAVSYKKEPRARNTDFYIIGYDIPNVDSPIGKTGYKDNTHCELFLLQYRNGAWEVLYQIPKIAHYDSAIEESINNNFKELNEKTDKIQGEVNDIYSKLTVVNNRLTNLENVTNEHTQLINELREDLTDTNERVTILEEGLDSLENELHEFKVATNTAISNIREVIVTLENTLNGKLTALDNKFTNEVSRLDARIDSAITDYNTKIDTLRNNMEVRVAELEAADALLNQKINNNHTTINNKVDAIKVETDNKITVMDEKFSDEVVRLDGRIDSAVADYDNKISGLRTEVNGHVADLKAADAALEQKVNNNHTIINNKVDAIKFETDNKITAVNNEVGANKAEFDQHVIDVNKALDGKSPVGHKHPISDVNNLQTELNKKAPLASPVFTGTPTAPTPIPTDNSLKLATTAFVAKAVSDFQEKILGGASSAFDTLKELEDFILTHESEYEALLTVVAEKYNKPATGIPKSDLESGVQNSLNKADTALQPSGTAAAATKLATARNFSITGAVTAPVVSFDGTANVVLNTTLTAHNHAISDVTGLQSALNAKAPLASPALMGVPTAPTAAAGNNTTQLATTAFVTKAVGDKTTITGNAGSATKLQTARNFAITGAVTAPSVSFDGTGNVLLVTTLTAHLHKIADVIDLEDSLASKAPLASPALTGVPTAPTATAGTNTMQLATTAFVTKAVGDKTTITGNAGSATKLQTARNFSITGAVTAPAVSFNGTGNVVLNTTLTAHSHSIGDITGLQSALDSMATSVHSHAIADVTGLQSALNTKAPLASPTFTGEPKGTTPSTSDSSTRLATTAFVKNFTEDYTVSARNLVIGEKTATYRSNHATSYPTELGTSAAGFRQMRRVAPFDNGTLSCYSTIYIDVEPSKTFACAVAVRPAATLPSTLRLASGVAKECPPGVWTTLYAKATSTAEGKLRFPGILGSGYTAENSAWIEYKDFQIVDADKVAGFLESPEDVRAEIEVELNKRAPLASPSLTGTPTAPTAAEGNTTSQLATTAYVMRAVRNHTAITGNAGSATKLQTARNFSITGAVTSPVVTFDGTGNVVLNTALTAHNHAISEIGGLQTALDGKAPTSHTHAIANVSGLQTALDGKAASSHTHTIANITNLQTTLDGKAPTSHTHSMSQVANLESALDAKAPLASPALTGVPTAPTATAGTNTTQLATTAFVTKAVADKTTITGNAGSATKLQTARNFSITGAVTASAVSFNGTGNVVLNTTLTAHSHTIANVTGLQSALDGKAPLASPALTGTPTAPTATTGSNNTQIATTAFVADAISSKAPLTHTHNSFTVQDIRSTDPTPNDMEDRAVTAFFNNQYGDTWRSGITVNGWTNGYGVWQLSNPSSTSAVESLKFRTGSGETWLPWRTIWHDGNDGTGSGLDADLLDGREATSFANASHTHTIANVSGLQTALDGKAPTSHTHTIANVSGLQTALDAKAPLASPTFTGTPTAPTVAGTTDNSTKIANTSFVQSIANAFRNEIKAWGVNQIAAYGSTAIDPNTSEDAMFLTAHANGPTTAYWYIRNYNYSSKVGNRFQMAYKYNSGLDLAWRQQFGGVWSEWETLKGLLGGKAASSHTHTIANVSGLQSALDGKAASSHTHTIANVSGLQSALDGKAATSHTHTIANVSGLQTTLDGKAASSHAHAMADVTGLANALNQKADTTHNHQIGDIDDLSTTLAGKAPISHTHTIANITNLQSTLNGKAATSHTHTIANVTNLQTTLDDKAPRATLKRRSSKDANGVFRVVEEFLENGTLYSKSTLSGGTSPKYTTRTIVFYNSAGTAIKTITSTLTYNADEEWLTEI